MQHIERTITVQQPKSRVWEYLKDFRSTNDWDPGTVRTVVRHGDGGVGTVYDNTSSFLGREVEIVYTVIDVEPEHLLRLEGTTDSLTATDTMTLTGDEHETTVVYRAEFVLHGAVKIVDPLMPIPLKKLGDDAEKELRRALEGLTA